jgi:hypothetical protein
MSEGYDFQNINCGLPNLFSEIRNVYFRDLGGSEGGVGSVAPVVRVATPLSQSLRLSIAPDVPMKESTPTPSFKTSVLSPLVLTAHLV